MSQKLDKKNFPINIKSLWQNVPIISYSILPIHWKYYSVKIGSISFFWTSDIEKFQDLLVCHAIGINFWLILLTALGFLNAKSKVW